jgi:hypothetical protein|eukprot:SAG25_NODE_45_length_19261_cov_61.009815_19_plen_128_part_00
MVRLQVKNWDAPVTRVRGRSLSQWRQMVTSHPFVISPHGHGLDCHRTWQVLLLGSFPVVMTSSLDSVYDGLPVVILQQWHDLTTKLLLGKAREFDSLNRGDIERRLLFPHWQKQIQAAQKLAKQSGS